MQKMDAVFGMFWQRERFRKKPVNEILFEKCLVRTLVLWYTDKMKESANFLFLGVCQ